MWKLSISISCLIPSYNMHFCRDVFCVPSEYTVTVTTGNCDWNNENKTYTVVNWNNLVIIPIIVIKNYAIWCHHIGTFYICLHSTYNSHFKLILFSHTDLDFSFLWNASLCKKRCRTKLGFCCMYRRLHLTENFRHWKKSLIILSVVPMRKRTEVISAIPRQNNQSVKWKAL